MRVVKTIIKLTAISMLITNLFGCQPKIPQVHDGDGMVFKDSDYRTEYANILDFHLASGTPYFAVAFLGYGTDMAEPRNTYIDKLFADLPAASRERIEHLDFDGDEWYLVVPRYRDDVTIKALDKDREHIIYNGTAFTVRCNLSDLHPNLEISTDANGGHKFSPRLNGDGTLAENAAVMDITYETVADRNELNPTWTKDQEFSLAYPAPKNIDELKKAVNVKDPRSVAAYFVLGVSRLTDSYDDGMEMMKYLFADIEPYGRGFTEGGMSGKAGWDTYFDERLRDSRYNKLPNAYFKDSDENNGSVLELHYNETNTKSINDQTLSELGRLNIVYWIQSNTAGNKVNITLSKFDGSNRWYVTSGTTSSALFYDQR